MIRLKRVYEAASQEDGQRLLVERLWPRGLRKANAHLNGWLKDIAPSPELRVWFGHDPAKWHVFCRRYFAELDSKPQVWQPLVDAMKKHRVTLVYSSHDLEHNNAVALKQYLEQEASAKQRRVNQKKAA
jgi:uncharacterized protein YeaO (DUF488 family)